MTTIPYDASDVGVSGRLAVLDADGLLMLPDRELVASRPPPGLDWPAMAARAQVDQLWVTAAGSETWGGLSDDAWVTWEGGGRRLAVVQPWRDGGSPWAEVTDAVHLLRELTRFERAMGGLWWVSGAVTSDRLLRSLHRGERCRPIRRTELPPPAEKVGGRAPAGAEGTITYVRAPLPEEGRRRYACHVDVNAMFLSAASSLTLPQGAPVRVDGPITMPGPAPRDSFLRRPGYWNVGEHPFLWRGEWVTTPTLELALQRGPVTVTEGWYWPDGARVLAPWYERIRDARAALIGCPGPALDAVKSVYRAGIGRLGSELRQHQDDPLFQPAWRHHVIAEARARLWRRVLAWQNCSPCAIQTDGLWYLCPYRDPVKIAAYIGWKIGDGLGEVSLDAVVDGAEARAVLDSGDRPGAVLRRLNALEPL